LLRASETWETNFFNGADFFRAKDAKSISG